MPRRRAAAPKVKVELVYEESLDIAEIAHRLIRLFPMRFGWTGNFKLGYILVKGARRKDDGERDYMGKFRKVPPIYHGLTGFDAVVEIKDVYWADLDAVEREALVAHELCHGEMSDKGALRVVKHDLTEFHWVVRQYGAWQPDIRQFDEQLALFDQAGQPTRATLGAQTSLTDDADLRPKGEVNVDELRGEAARSSEPTPIRKPRNGGAQPPAPH